MWKTDFGPFAEKSKFGEDGINYNPPTEEEKQATEDHKDNLAEKDDDDTQPPATDNGGLKQVKPFISVAQQFKDDQYGDRIEVHAYVPEIIESGGKCSFTFSQGGNQVAWQTDGLPNVSTTNCDTALVPRDKFPQTGTWSLVINYKSSNAEGTSDAIEVKVE